MSSQIEELMPLQLGTSKPETSIERHWTEVRYDGKEGSWVLSVGVHWHKNHDEIMEVLEGRMIISLDGKERLVSARDPPVLIPRGHPHGASTIKGQPVTVKERTVPTGTFKALFFQDLLQLNQFPSFFMIMRVFYDGDTYIALPGGFKMLDYLFITMPPDPL